MLVKFGVMHVFLAVSIGVLTELLMYFKLHWIQLWEKLSGLCKYFQIKKISDGKKRFSDEKSEAQGKKK